MFDETCALPVSLAHQQRVCVCVCAQNKHGIGAGDSIGVESDKVTLKYAEAALCCEKKLRNELWTHAGQTRGASRNSCRCLRKIKNESVQMMTICCPQTGMQMCFAWAQRSISKVWTRKSQLWILSVTQRLLQAFLSCTQLEADSQRRTSRTEGWTNPGGRGEEMGGDKPRV